MKRIAPYLRYLLSATAGFHRSTALRTVLGIVGVGVSLLFVWLSKTAIDFATGRTSSGSLTLRFSLMIAAMLTQIAIARWLKYSETRSTVRMTNSANRRIFNTLATAPLVNGQQGFHSGDMLNRLTLDVRTVANFALVQLPAMIVMLVQLLGSFIFLAILNPWLAIAPVLIMPVCILSGRLYFRRQRTLTARQRALESRAHITIQEGLKHRLVLLTLDCVSVVNRRLRSVLTNLDSTNRDQARLSSLSSTLTRLGFAAGFLTAFGFGIFGLQAGAITFGTMTAFLQLVSRIQNPIASLTTYVPAFISTSVAIDRLREIDRIEPDEPHTLIPILRPAGVRLNKVTFSYGPESEPILTDFFYDFRPGSRTLIVGPTGAGKSTLIRLLLGLLRPDSGRITVYDDTVGYVASRSTLPTFVYVPQGNSLLPGTIRDNLLLAHPGASDDLLAEVLHVADADFVHTLPAGLDTACDETGGGLSVGQAQRIAIARALLRPGSILLLDEFNSALDAPTATTIMERLIAYRPTATLIIIAHHHTPLTPYLPTILHLPAIQ